MEAVELESMPSAAEIAAVAETVRKTLSRGGGLRRLRREELSVLRTAVERATSFRPDGYEGLSSAIESLLELMDASAAGGLAPEEELMISAFVRPLAVGMPSA